MLDNGQNMPGKISWKFKVPENAMKFIKIGKVNLDLRTKTFHPSAKIILKVINESNKDVVVPGKNL